MGKGNTTEQKRHYKLYKSGTKWVSAAIITFGAGLVVLGGAPTATTHAAENEKAAAVATATTTDAQTPTATAAATQPATTPAQTATAAQKAPAAATTSAADSNASAPAAAATTQALGRRYAVHRRRFNNGYRHQQRPKRSRRAVCGDERVVWRQLDHRR